MGARECVRHTDIVTTTLFIKYTVQISIVFYLYFVSKEVYREKTSSNIMNDNLNVEISQH